MLSEYSTIGPLRTVIAQTLGGAGVDTAPLFKEVGLDLAALRDPNTRIPSSAFQALMALAQQATSDPVFGLSLAQYVHPTTFQLHLLTGICRLIMWHRTPDSCQRAVYTV